MCWTRADLFLFFTSLHFHNEHFSLTLLVPIPLPSSPLASLSSAVASPSGTYAFEAEVLQGQNAALAGMLDPRVERRLLLSHTAVGAGENWGGEAREKEMESRRGGRYPRAKLKPLGRQALASVSGSLLSVPIGFFAGSHNRNCSISATVNTQSARIHSWHLSEPNTSTSHTGPFARTQATPLNQTHRES